ncbi:MAG: hypothetical protein EAZ85_05315 [Bacteroidetes bacterium]|nr:MAG: hypothetical protein EAZ85_05315 [Bacteroidota bacterium]TAG90067.1 MAG: hypothetical protein EAZ20_05120 [Bacteroidota bacterium]
MHNKLNNFIHKKQKIIFMKVLAVINILLGVFSIVGTIVLVMVSGGGYIYAVSGIFQIILSIMVLIQKNKN